LCGGLSGGEQNIESRKSAKEIDRLRQKFVSHMERKYMEIFIKQYRFLESPRELLIGPGLTELVSKYEDAYPL
jgi:hypothetical protein